MRKFQKNENIPGRISIYRARCSEKLELLYIREIMGVSIGRKKFQLFSRKLIPSCRIKAMFQKVWRCFFLQNCSKTASKNKTSFGVESKSRKGPFLALANSYHLSIKFLISNHISPTMLGPAPSSWKSSRMRIYEGSRSLAPQTQEKISILRIFYKGF